MWPLLLAAGCTAPEAEGEPADPRFEELRRWTEVQLREWDVPGAAIAIVEEGELRQVAGIGVRHWGLPAPVTPNTRFRVGSVSKMVAGALAAEEIAAGRLVLDAPASDALGALPLVDGRTAADFTLLQLLGHASGLQSTGLPYTCDTDPDALADVLAEVAPTWALWTPPGELYNYANQNYSLVGLAVERATGERYVDLAQGLFDGAGMATATYDWVEGATGDFAMGHTMDRATGEPTDFRGFEERACVASYPSGGMMASATDLGHLLEVLVNGGAGWVSPEAWEVMTTEGWSRSETSGYGFGLSSTSYQGYPSLVHTGTVGGWLAIVWAVPSEGFGVAAVVNVSHVVTDPPEPWSKPTQRIVEHALNAYLGLEPEVRVSSARPPEDWDRYVGLYRSAYELGDVAIARIGDDLWYTDATRTVELLPYGRDSFLYAIPDDDGTNDYVGVSFEEGSSEDIRWVLTDIGIAERVDPTAR